VTSYDLLTPPFNPDFIGMPRDELARYRDWFLAVIPERVAQLERVVRATAGFEAWTADGTPGSLSALGQWFATQVSTRPLGADELKAMEKRLSYPIEISPEDLDHRTLSLAVDIGIYFSQVLMRNVAGLRWEQDLTDKRNADYGRLVVVGSGRVPLNPVAIMITLAYGFVRKSKTADRLAELYPIWVGALHPAKA
jgi:hypothetical protein